MIYVVKAGDTLYSIAATSGVSAPKITYDNQLPNPDQLVPGQALLILMPGELPGRRRDMRVTGYSYPFVEPYTLAQSLPVLDELLVFSYGYTFEGELIPPETDELWMIEAAWKTGVKPILVLTPFSESGAFNNLLVSAVVQNAVVQERLIQNLVNTVQDRGYAGVDIDFEYILAEDRVAYAEFVGNVQAVMSALGYQTSVAVAPKTSADQKGLLYEGMDYRLLGKNADYVFLMTYEWGYAYSLPMAVAPINKVRKVVEYALTEIPPNKIVMGIPNYGYDWTLPVEKGVTRAKTIGNVEAVRIAADNGAVIKYDETAQSPFFQYTRDKIKHEVWFEDVRSITAKMALADEKKLLGVGYWNLMRPFRANWILLDS